jgi:hypothetical protein
VIPLQLIMAVVAGWVRASSRRLCFANIPIAVRITSQTTTSRAE